MKGIDLLRLMDTETVEWGSYITVPALVRDLKLEWRASLEDDDDPGAFLPPETPFYNPDGSREGTVRDLVARLWKHGTIPEEPGHGTLRLSAGERLFIKRGDRLVEAKLRVEAKTWYDWYLGDIPLTTMRGFADEHTGRLRVERLATDWLRFEEIQRAWKHVPAPDQLAIKPVITLYVKDAPAGDPDATRSVRITLMPAEESSVRDTAG